MSSFTSCIKQTGKRILDDRYDHIGRTKPIVNNKKLWRGWEYNVGTSKYIKDNSDINALMSPLTPIYWIESIMVYNPSLYNKEIEKKDNSYQIHQGTYTILFFREMNISYLN